MPGFLAELLIATLIAIGGFFLLVGSYGLVKLAGIMTRLHAPTKATTVGVGSVLIASMLYFSIEEGRVTIHEAVITLFMFFTAPITANFIAKAHLHRSGDTLDLPPTRRPVGWATFDPPTGPPPAVGEERG